MADSKNDITQLSFEEALEQLDQIVKKFENAEVNLDQSIDDYTLGSNLHAHCAKKLANAKMKIEKIVKAKNGDIKKENFEEDSE